MHNCHRGGPLERYDAETRDALARLGPAVDASRLLPLWEHALASSWQRPPVWLHGDISPANLLVRDGRLAAVIDFGCCGVGDPACDLAIAWSWFAAPARTAFRQSLPLDADTWDRARGWALWKTLITMASGDPLRVEPSRRILAQLLA